MPKKVRLTNRPRGLPGARWEKVLRNSLADSKVELVVSGPGPKPFKPVPPKEKTAKPTPNTSSRTIWRNVDGGFLLSPRSAAAKRLAMTGVTFEQSAQGLRVKVRRDKLDGRAVRLITSLVKDAAK